MKDDYDFDYGEGKTREQEAHASMWIIVYMLAALLITIGAFVIIFFTVLRVLDQIHLWYTLRW